MNGGDFRGLLTRVLFFAVGCVLTWFAEGCGQGLNFTTTLCNASGELVSLYASGENGFSIVDGDDAAVSIVQNRIAAQSLFSTDDVFIDTWDFSVSTNPVSLSASLLLEWEEGGTDYQLSFSDCSYLSEGVLTGGFCGSEITGGSLVSQDISEIAGGQNIEVVYLDAEDRLRTLSGTLTNSFFYVSADLVPNSCRIDCDEGFLRECDCTYSCANGDSGSYSSDSGCGNEEDQYNYLSSRLACTIDSLSVTSPYTMFEIELE